MVRGSLPLEASKLPLEIWDAVLKYLPLESYLRLSQTSHAFYGICPREPVLGLEAFVAFLNRKKKLRRQDRWKSKVHVTHDDFHQSTYDLLVRHGFHSEIQSHLAIPGALDRIDPSGHDQYAICRMAGDSGAMELLPILLHHPLVDPSANNNEPIRNAAQNGLAVAAAYLLGHPRFSPLHMDTVIEIAVKRNHIEVVDLFLRDARLDITCKEQSPIRIAAESGHLALVELLLRDPRVDPSAKNSYSLRMACAHGHVGVAKRLLQDPRVDPTQSHELAPWRNQALRMACENGHAEVVSTLLQDSRMDPTEGESEVLVLAVAKNRIDCVRALLDDGRVDVSVALETALPGSFMRQLLEDHRAVALYK
ncbi:hypothetical protein HDV03_002322 [Kappamyces sp. JEL0829]|nr:hypothetical protein HDV03_002322 [Kappamyces sp. JEL0829]